MDGLSGPHIVSGTEFPTRLTVDSPPALSKFCRMMTPSPSLRSPAATLLAMVPRISSSESAPYVASYSVIPRMLEPGFVEQWECSIWQRVFGEVLLVEIQCFGDAGDSTSFDEEVNVRTVSRTTAGPHLHGQHRPLIDRNDLNVPDLNIGCQVGSLDTGMNCGAELLSHSAPSPRRSPISAATAGRSSIG
jgi:hypothetical protein